MARTGTTATATGGVCQVRHGTGGGEVHVGTHLRHLQLAAPRPGYRHDNAPHGAHRNAEGDGLRTGLCLVLPHALPRGHDGQLPLFGHRDDTLFRHRHTLRRTDALRYAHKHRTVYGAADDTDIHLRHDMALLPCPQGGRHHRRHVRCDHPVGVALLRVRDTFQCGVGADCAYGTAGGLYALLVV